MSGTRGAKRNAKRALDTYKLSQINDRENPMDKPDSGKIKSDGELGVILWYEG